MALRKPIFKKLVGRKPTKGRTTVHTLPKTKRGRAFLRDYRARGLK